MTDYLKKAEPPTVMGARRLIQKSHQERVICNPRPLLLTDQTRKHLSSKSNVTTCINIDVKIQKTSQLLTDI